jgi:cytochrome c5
MNTYTGCWLWLALLVALAACTDGSSEPLQGSADSEEASTSSTGEHSAAPQYDLAQGEAVFRAKCLTCHGEGVAAAPRLGSALEWQSRLGQGLPTLIDHAINGHGRMPARGGFQELSEAEIASAVAYVVDASETIIMAGKREQTPSDCHPVRAPDKCTETEAEQILTLHMLWLLSTPDKH